ncbi:hypothetical protein [Novosphingopyxis iocasae]|uniref:hypothetical protein n=1 Tax=Novosphingopyxis iocasae TaxID=2762729 RepID=UPI001651A8B2|nr:hypothetical protein [Novosphingopyxis iocasae]
MDSFIKSLIFIIVTTNAGGQAKSLIADLCKSLFLMMGYDVATMDADPGNSTAIHLDSRTDGITWGSRRSIASTIASAYEGKQIVLDCGANMWASEREITELLPELASMLEAVGYRTVVLLPYTPNKPRAAATLQDLEPHLPGTEKIYIRSNSDGSGAFDPLDPSKSVIDLGYLQPGFIQHLNENGRRSFFDLVSNPHPNRVLASNYIGQWMHDFADAASKYNLFADAVPMLAKIPAQPKLRFGVNTLERCTDKALRKIQSKSVILDHIDRFGWDEAGLLKAAAALAQRSDKA